MLDSVNVHRQRQGLSPRAGSVRSVTDTVSIRKRPASAEDRAVPAVARQLNERLRKTLGYEMPTERYQKTVASIS